MIQVSEQDRAYLLKNGIDISDALAADDFQTALDVIDDAIIENILCNNDEPDMVGIELQKIYDRINSQ